MTRAGYFGPNSVAWRIHSDPVGWIGGGRALLVQALHPVAMAVFTQNTNYQDDPWGRLWRTSDYFIATIFGDREMADRASARVRAIHERASAIDPRSGELRRADEPELLLWIHATALDSFIEVHRRFVGGLSSADEDSYVEEMGVMAKLLGIPTALIPHTVADLDDYLKGMETKLEATDEALEAARWMLFYPPIPKALRPAWIPFSAAVVSSLPGYARRLYGLPWTRAANLPVKVTVFGATRLMKRFLKPPPLVSEAMDEMNRRTA